jgi:hypothetical protein
MSFRGKVDETPDISGCCQTGLQAIKGSDRAKFACDDTRKIDGSVEIDTCVKERYHGENRWDYAIGYDDKVYFVEIHGASTSDISTMSAKLKWLKKWLKGQKSSLLNGATYHWVSSGKVNITGSNPKLKSLATQGLLGPKRACRCQ